MNIEIVKEEKNELELKIDNLTVAEIMRVYLQDYTDFAAWRREHPFKPLIFRIESGNVRKSVNDSVSAAKKDLDKVSAVVAKAK